MTAHRSRITSCTAAHERPQPSRRGSILLYVVWIIMLLSLFAAGVGSQALFALNLSDRLAKQLGAVYAARAAVPYAVKAIEHDPTPAIDGRHEVWSNDPALFRQHPVAGGSFTVTADVDGGQEPRYGLADEERKLNLNTAPLMALQALLMDPGGLRERDAEETAGAIVDWRDADTDEHAGGAENYYYETRNPGYDCKDAPFENAEELLLVKGVGPALYSRIEPFVTVYGSGRVNLNTASPTVLRALGLSPAGVAGLETFRAGNDSLEGTDDDLELESVAAVQSTLRGYVPAEDLARLTALAGEKLLSTSGEAFRMSIQAEAGGPLSRMRVVCVVDRTGEIKQWSEQ